MKNDRKHKITYQVENNLMKALTNTNQITTLDENTIN